MQGQRRSRLHVYQAVVRPVDGQQTLTVAVHRVESCDTMHILLQQAIACPTLEAFRTALGTVQTQRLLGSAGVG